MERWRARRLDEIIKEDLFTIDLLACAAAADVIRDFRSTRVENDASKYPLSALVTFKVALVAICHQINWEFLESRLRPNLLSHADTDLASQLASIEPGQVAAWLGSYHRPERIRALERSLLLRDVGNELGRLGHRNALPLLTASQGQIEGPTGFLKQLDVFRAYREDPLKKKSYALIQELVRNHLAVFNDDRHIQPAIDYHVMRVYLRTGRVVPRFREVAAILSEGRRPRPRLVKVLREAVAEAMRTTSFYAGLSVPEVNYIEWQIGRSVCATGKPLCLDSRRKITIDPDIRALGTSRCPYSVFCAAFREDKWRQLQEPKFISRFY